MRKILIVLIVSALLSGGCATSAGSLGSTRSVSTLQTTPQEPVDPSRQR